MKIFLIGLPGSGKTTIGRQLSETLNETFIDLDEEIVRKAKQSIKEIFANQGEEYFRKLERDALHEITESRESFVMSTGGGAPAFEDNMPYMNDNGVTVFLNLPIEEIRDRMSETRLEDRPLFANSGNIEERLRELLEQRLQFYKQAKLIVDSVKDSHEIAQLLTKM